MGGVCRVGDPHGTGSISAAHSRSDGGLRAAVCCAARLPSLERRGVVWGKELGRGVMHSEAPWP